MHDSSIEDASDAIIFNIKKSAEASTSYSQSWQAFTLSASIVLVLFNYSNLLL